MVEMLSTMLICESSGLQDDGLAESDERMKSRALENIFTSSDPMDRSLVAIAEKYLNRDTYEKIPQASKEALPNRTRIN